MSVLGCTGCGAGVEVPYHLLDAARKGPVFCGSKCPGRHPSGCALRKDGVPYHDVRCAACFCRITFTGETALIVHGESGTGRWYCDETCERGSGVSFRWQRAVFGRELADMQREVAKRRIAVSEGRR